MKKYYVDIYTWEVFESYPADSDLRTLWEGLADCRESARNISGEILNKAIKAFNRLATYDCVYLREQIVDTASECGQIHIWLNVFATDSDMYSRLQKIQKI